MAAIINPNVFKTTFVKDENGEIKTVRCELNSTTQHFPIKDWNNILEGKAGLIAEENGNILFLDAKQWTAIKQADNRQKLEDAKKDNITVVVSQGNAIIHKLMNFIETTEIEPQLFINNGRNTQILYNWAKQKGAKILYKPWRGDLKQAFANNELLIQETIKNHGKVIIFWDGNDIVVRDMYIRCLNQKVRHETILLNEEDELVRCDDFIDALYHMRNELDKGEDPEGTLMSEINQALRRVFLGWATPANLKEIERHLQTFGLFLDIGFNTGWSIDDEEAGGHLVEESEYDGYGFDEAYV